MLLEFFEEFSILFSFVCLLYNDLQPRSLLLNCHFVLSKLCIKPEETIQSGEQGLPELKPIVFCKLYL